MSSPIKPPGSPSGAPPSEGPDAADRARPTGEASEAFRQKLDETSSSGGPEGASAAQGTSEAAGAAAAEGANPVQEVAADLRAGRIDVDTAVDRLVERAMSGGAAGALPPAKRAELETFLRGFLADDPTMVALTKDLERGD